MATVSFTSTATGIGLTAATLKVRPLKFTSTATGVGGAGLVTPRVLNVLGEIGPIPYYTFS